MYKRQLAHAVDVDERVEEVVPRPYELEDCRREKRRLAQRHQDLPEDLEGIAAVNPCRLIQFHRHAAEKLDHHVDEERRTGKQRRDDKRQIRVQPTQLVKKQIARDDNDRVGQHQRGEHQDEQWLAQPEAETRKAVSNQCTGKHGAQHGREDHEERIHKERRIRHLARALPALLIGIPYRLLGQKGDAAEDLPVRLERCLLYTSRCV